MTRKRGKRKTASYGPTAPVPERRPRATRAIGVPYTGLGHAKSKDLVDGRCWLCGDYTQLELSHIIPRWAYREWAGSGGGVAMKWDLSQASPAQDGPKFYLLCGTCERYLGEGEGLLRRVQRDDPGTLFGHGVNLGANAFGLPELQGSKRTALHRGLVGIGFKILATQPAPDAEVERTLEALRPALLKDDYSGISAPFAFRIVGGAALRDDLQERVSFGATERAARFTMGDHHWVVPLRNDGRRNPAIDWTVLEHEVGEEDLPGQLWVESDAIDIVGIVRRTLAQSR